MIATTESHQNITETIWTSLDKELSKKGGARSITQALTRMFVKNPILMQGLWEAIKDIFPKEKNLSTKEDFINYLHLLQSGNNTVSEEEWGVLTECFRKFCYYEITTAMAYHDICIDDYVDDTTWTPFKTLVCNRISSYKQQLMQNPANVDKKQLMPPSLVISCSPSEEDNIPVVDRTVIASYLSLPSSVFEVYFKGELSGNWNR